MQALLHLKLPKTRRYLELLESCVGALSSPNGCVVLLCYGCRGVLLSCVTVVHCVLFTLESCLVSCFVVFTCLVGFVSRNCLLCVFVSRIGLFALCLRLYISLSFKTIISLLHQRSYLSFSQNNFKTSFSIPSFYHISPSPTI